MLLIIPDLLKQIIKFTILPNWKLVKWIDIDRLKTKYLSSNPNAIQLLKSTILIEEKYIEFINIIDDVRTNELDDRYLINDNHRIEWRCIGKNPNAIKIIKRNLKTNCVIFIDDVYTNKNLIKLIKNRTNKHNSSIVSNINAYTLIKNDAGILLDYFDEILQNPGMIKLIKKK